jgi:hypothetical protein
MLRRSLRWLVVPAVGLAAAVVIAGCASTASAPTWTFGPVSSPAAPTAAPGAAGMAGMADMPGTAMADPPANAVAAAAISQSATAPVAHLDLIIVTGDMTGHTEYPAYIPADFTLPANSTVVVTITNFDDATPLAKDMVQYATVAGTGGGTMRVTPINVGTPNGASGPLRVLAKLDPAAVSHTFTIPALGINVPPAAHARTVFTIQTGAPGTYYWRCFDPCGAGSTGWGTAMAAKSGFMEGTLTVA